MTRKEIFAAGSKGIVIDADNLDDMYTVYDQDKLYKLFCDKAEEWLRSKLIDDHVDTDHGIGCLIPDMILCDEYFTVNDFIKGFRKGMYDEEENDKAV